MNLVFTRFPGNSLKISVGVKRSYPMSYIDIFVWVNFFELGIEIFKKKFKPQIPRVL